MNNQTSIAIQAENLEYEYAPGRGVCGVSFSVQAGECCAVLGRNGSGKSTLARILIGLLRPSSGSLSILGFSPKNNLTAYRIRLGVVLDTSHHWESLSGYDNAWFVGRSYGMSTEVLSDRLGRLFEQADLHSRGRDQVNTYSFGMRRKLSFIQALCHEPEILILDEPTTGMDAHFLVSLAEIIKNRSESGKTTWISGNDPDWIAGVAFRVAFMDNGRIITEGSVPGLVSEVSPYQEIRAVLSRPLESPTIDFNGLQSFHQRGDTIHALIEHKPELVTEMMERIITLGGEIQSLEVKHSTLRDAFLLKTGKTLDE